MHKATGAEGDSMVSKRRECVCDKVREREGKREDHINHKVLDESGCKRV